jgi:hypothetical protein
MMGKDQERSNSNDLIVSNDVIDNMVYQFMQAVCTLTLYILIGKLWVTGGFKNVKDADCVYICYFKGNPAYPDRYFLAFRNGPRTTGWDATVGIT